VVAALGGALGQSIREVFEPFEKKYNVKIKWDTVGSSVENVARAAATKDKPVFDLIFGDMTQLPSGTEQGIWAPLDEKVVTNYKDQMPQARSDANDIVFYGFIATGLFYANKEFEKRGWKPPTRWTDLLDKKYCGRVGINHPNVSYGVQMLIMLGGGNPAKINDGIAKLAADKDCIPVLEPTAAKLEEKIALGEYLIGVQGSVRIVPMTQKGIPVKFVIPEEGPAMYASGVAPVKNSPNARLAQEFCNWILAYADLGVPDAEVVKRSSFIPAKVITDNRRAWTRQVERAMEK
jgi:putative spermidine/putrescine transport system substrate-binding protein